MYQDDRIFLYTKQGMCAQTRSTSLLNLSSEELDAKRPRKQVVQSPNIGASEAHELPRSPLSALSLDVGLVHLTPRIVRKSMQICSKELNQTTAAVFTCFLVYPCFRFTPASIGVHPHCSNQHLKWRVLNIIKFNRGTSQHHRFSKPCASGPPSQHARGPSPVKLPQRVQSECHQETTKGFIEKRDHTMKKQTEVVSG